MQVNPEDIKNIDQVLKALYILCDAAEKAAFEKDYDFTALSVELDKAKNIIYSTPMSERNAHILIFLKTASMMLLDRKSDKSGKRAGQKEEEVVYFLLDEHTNYLKIGRTISLYQRIKALECGVGRKLVLLGSVKGGCKIETKYHQQFKEHRRTGEWFEATPEVLEQVKRLFKHKKAA